MVAHWGRGAAPPSSQPQAPTQPNPADRRRAIEQAQAQAQVGDYYTGLPLDVMGMQRVSPDQLSGLLKRSHGGSLSYQSDGSTKFKRHGYGSIFSARAGLRLKHGGRPRVH